MPLKDPIKRKEWQKNYVRKKCPHNRRKSACKDCKGGEICIHNHLRSTCKECLGISFCIHKVLKWNCKPCGGNIFCEHGKRKTICPTCDGSALYQHLRQKRQCKDCSVPNFLIHLQRGALHRALKNSNLEKTKTTIEYLGCDGDFFKTFIESKMKEGMNWDNIHLDHIKPVIAFDLCNHEEFLDCCHYTNFQPLLAEVNLTKASKWNDTDDAFWNENIKGKKYLEIYLPS